jgi:hypothetical protein
MGLLFPLVLVSTGRWRAFFSACAAALIAIALPWLLFGADSFRAFVHFLPQASDSLLAHGAAGLNKQQTIYGLAHWLGCGESAAWLLQGAVALVAAIAVVKLWRGNASFALKAAALSTATLFATPYLYMYDYPILAVPLAFLFRDREFDCVELAGMALAGICLLAYACGVVAMPIGPAAVACVASLILRRTARSTETAADGRLAMQAA